MKLPVAGRALNKFWPYGVPDRAGTSYLRKPPSRKLETDRDCASGVEERTDRQAIRGAPTTPAKGLRLDVLAAGREGAGRGSIIDGASCDLFRHGSFSGPLAPMDFAAGGDGLPVRHRDGVQDGLRHRPVAERGLKGRRERID